MKEKSDKPILSAYCIHLHYIRAEAEISKPEHITPKPPLPLEVNENVVCHNLGELTF